MILATFGVFRLGVALLFDDAGRPGLLLLGEHGHDSASWRQLEAVLDVNEELLDQDQRFPAHIVGNVHGLLGHDSENFVDLLGV